MVRSTSELSSAVWWIPRALLGGRSAEMYWAFRRARSASIAARSMAGCPFPWCVLRDAQLDADVAASGPGVRAALVRGIGQFPGLLPVQARDDDDERDHQVVHVALGSDADLGGDRGLASVHPGQAAQRAVETGRVGGREQLLGVGAVAAGAT